MERGKAQGLAHQADGIGKNDALPVLGILRHRRREAANRPPAAQVEQE